METNRTILTEQNAKIVDLFIRLITQYSDPNTMRKSLTRIYADHTKLLISNAAASTDNFIRKDTADDLCYLTEMIEVLEGGY